jgi:Glycosyltransferase 61
MQIEVERSSLKPESTVPVAPSKLFTFPTRLAGAWAAEGLEIHLPGYSLRRPALDLSVRTGTTKSQQIGFRNPPRYLYGKLAPQVSISGTHLFDARFDNDTNIAHVLLNVGPAVLHSKETFGGVTVIVRSNASALGREAYRLLGCSVVNTDRDVYGEVIVPPDGRNGVYEAWYPALYSPIDIAGQHSITPERVFISRRGARRLINEEQVAQTLARYGFHKMYFEDIPLAQQWWIARNAKAVVGIHGAALSSLVFNSRGVKLLELFHPGYVVNIYRHLTNAIGGAWCGVTGQMPAGIIRELDVKRKARKYAHSPTRMDIGSLCRALEYLGVRP